MREQIAFYADGIEIERDNQDQKWGAIQVNPHDLETWVVILSKQVGDLSHAVFRLRSAPRFALYNPDARDPDGHQQAMESAMKGAIQNVRHQLFQVAAVAVAALEDIDSQPDAIAQRAKVGNAV